MRRKGLSFSLMLCAGVLSFGMAATVTACSNNSTNFATVRLSKNSIELHVGEDTELKAQVSKQFVNSTVTWLSTNESVAMVAKGHVVALGTGECEIYAFIAGGHDVCKVKVVEGSGGGGGSTTTPYLRVSPSNKTIAVGQTFNLTVSKYPSDGAVSYTSSADTIASVSTTGVVSALVAGSATITASMTVENVEYTSRCEVTVNEDSGGGGSSSEGIPDNLLNLKATGSFVIGSPTVYKDMTNELLKDFNKYTNSNITWEIKDFEENTAASNLTPDASLGPDVFPYASDQTQGLNTLNALNRLSKSEQKWIRESMGDDALKAAQLSSAYVGYPFASDNSYVMFYDSSLAKPEEIDTLSKLFDKASKLTDGRKSYRVSYNLVDGFYGAAALMTYAKGENLYTYTPNVDGSFTSSSTFNSEVGLKGATAVLNIFKNNKNTLDSTMTYPGASSRTLATITDCSKVLGMKQTMGKNYAVAPLPLNDLVEGEEPTRLGSFAGYKFYGVNNKKLGNNTAKKDIACAIAQFLVCEYAQNKRLETFGIRPTILNLQAKAASEPHVAALNIQEQDKSAIPLTVVDSAFWSQTGSAVADIKSVAQGTLSKELADILKDLDTTLYHK